ncbi:MAG: hypothetical protein V4556_12450 [Bacteroidota bacterium]
MLKYYKYQNQSIEQIHGLIMDAFIIICAAKPQSKFSINKFSLPLQELMLEEQTKEKDLLFEPLKNIYELIKNEKNAAVKKLLLQGLKNNNKIEELCNDTKIDPVLYKELPDPLVKILKPFFNNLYEKFLNRAHVVNKYQTLKKHFDSLVIASNIQVCPFCGINDMQSQYDDGRDAYDHYLPKGTFPFSSINFKNLVPMCYECNSKHKLEKSIIFEDLRGRDKKRRKIGFYPFGNINNTEIKITFSIVPGQAIPNSLKKLVPNNLSIVISAKNKEKMESWNKVFRIDKRYKAKSCQFLISWIDTLLEDYRKTSDMLKAKYNVSISWDDFLDTELEIREEELLKNKNLIRVAFLKMLRDKCDLLMHLKNWNNTHYN